MKWKAIGALALTTILFSTFEVVSRLIAFDIEPLQVNFLRFIIGGLALLPLAIMDMRKQSIRLDGGDFKNLLWLGLLNVTFCLSIFQISIKYIPASAAAVIFCTNPVFVHIFESWRGGHNFSRLQVLGLTSGIIGLFMVMGNEIILGSGSWKGAGMAVIASISYGLYIVQARDATQKMGSLAVNSLSFILGAIAIIPLLLALHIPLFKVEQQLWPWIIYLSLAVTSLAYYLFLYGLQHLPPGAGSLLFFIKPVLAAALAAFALHENLTLLFIMGTIVIIAGLLIYSWGNTDIQTG